MRVTWHPCVGTSDVTPMQQHCISTMWRLGLPPPPPQVKLLLESLLEGLYCDLLISVLLKHYYLKSAFSYYLARFPTLESFPIRLEELVSDLYSLASSGTNDSRCSSTLVTFIAKVDVTGTLASFPFAK